MFFLQNTTKIFDSCKVGSLQFFKRVLAKRRAWSKDCRVNDKVAAAKQALAAGLHSHCSRSVSPKHFEDDDCKYHLEDDDFYFDFDVEEESDRSVYPGEEEFDYSDLHFCPMTQLYYEDYMRRRNEWFDRYFEELYAQRELEQAEKEYFIESCWDAILVNCH
jgi:hypothetical protein